MPRFRLSYNNIWSDWILLEGLTVSDLIIYLKPFIDGSINIKIEYLII